jgi:hypothetical protein
MKGLFNYSDLPCAIESGHMYKRTLVISGVDAFTTYEDPLAVGNNPLPEPKSWNFYLVKNVINPQVYEPYNFRLLY